jgi:hypothetical protein
LLLLRLLLGVLLRVLLLLCFRLRGVHSRRSSRNRFLRRRSGSACASAGASARGSRAGRRGRSSSTSRGRASSRHRVHFCRTALKMS